MGTPPRSPAKSFALNIESASAMVKSTVPLTPLASFAALGYAGSVREE